MIAALVFSRNRAMQLDALLRSIRVCAPTLYGSVSVLYRADSADHDLAYLDCFRAHRDVVAVEQSSRFEIDVRDWLEERTQGVAFHCDDDVFYRRPTFKTLGAGVAGYSLRLGSNTFRCHPQGGREFEPPKVLYRWPAYELDAGYPFSLNGHVYRAETVRALIEGLTFDGPNDLEAQGDARWVAEPRRFGEWLGCGTFSSVVTIPANRVNDGYANPCGDTPEEQPDALCAAFLDGWRVDLAGMDFTRVEGCHQEIPLRFSR